MAPFEEFLALKSLDPCFDLAYQRLDACARTSFFSFEHFSSSVSAMKWPSLRGGAQTSHSSSKTNHAFFKMAAQKTLLFLFLLSFEASWSYELVGQLSDRVEAGEGKYYTVNPSPITLICLVSDEGDADIYVDFSSTTTRPDYLTHKYSATSSGIDVVTVLRDKMEVEGDSISIGVYGHVTHGNSTFRMYIIVPSSSDVLEHQIWELDHESNTTKLIIDVDPLWIANDPKLHRLLESISGDYYYQEGGVSGWIAVKDGILWLLVNVLQLVVEILL